MAQQRGLGAVVGMDLAGDEAHYNNSAYVPCFRRAKHLGLKTTIHAGESRGCRWSEGVPGFRVLISGSFRVLFTHSISQGVLYASFTSVLCAARVTVFAARCPL